MSRYINGVANVSPVRTALVFLSIFSCSALSNETQIDSSPRISQVSVMPYQAKALMDGAQILFDGNTNRLGGWDHVAKYPDEFAGLALPKTNYRVDSSPKIVSNNRYYQTVLVRKYANWQRQHSNGITSALAPLKFQDVAGIELILRINGEKSNLPSNTLLTKAYGQLVSDKQIATLDDGNVHLSVSLREDKPSRKSSPRFNAEYMLSLNAITQLDRWYHIFIPISAFTRYNEANYAKDLLTTKQASELVIANFKLNAETLSGKAIRHLIRDSYHDSVPKLFKEVALELNYLAVVHNK